MPLVYARRPAFRHSSCCETGMKMRIVMIAAALIPAGAQAADALTSLHPEAAYPDESPRMSSPGPYAALYEAVQWKLRDLGFDAGPLNGDFGSKTQAALAQFQLSQGLPVSGMLDERTLAELGIRTDSAAGNGG
jgi:peptidoglycan hydrolase-like protein with peptidoglycan-binding domain